MALLRHPESLLQSAVYAEPGRAENRVPARIAELINRLQDKRRRIEPSLRRCMIHALALARRVGTVISDVRIGAVYAGSRVDRESGAPSGNTAELPSAGDRIEDVAFEFHLSAFTRR